MTLDSTMQIDQLSNLAKQLQGASSFRSAELAKQMAGIAEEFQRQRLTVELPEAAQSHRAMQDAAEEIRLAIESATKTPAADVAAQLAGITEEFQKQREQLVAAIAEAARPSLELYEAAREIRSTLESTTRQAAFEEADRMLNELRKTQGRFEDVLESQAHSMRDLMETLIESIRKGSGGGGASGDGA